MKKLNKKRSLLSLLAAFGLCTLLHGTAFAEGASGSDTVDDVTVTISTNRTEYESGDCIDYSITVQNNKANWNSDATHLKYTLTEGLLSADGEELETAIPIVRSGESYTLTGKLVGDPVLFPKTEKKSNPVIIIILCVVALVAVCSITLVVIMTKQKKKITKELGKKELLILGILLAGALLAASNLPSSAATYETVTLRPYVQVMYAGQEVTLRCVVEFHMYEQVAKIPSEYADQAKTVTCHDPSIFKDVDGKYYIFGSFLASAYSEDLKDWTSFDQEFHGTFSDEVKAQIRAWNDDETAGSWKDYLWAPDIIYNPVLQKYCMYLSADGDNWISNIVLLTADEVTGPYDYAGSVVYSGFTEETYDKADVSLATGEETIAERYITNGVANKKWGDEFPNCIDPCVFYDEEGNLWMSYGSWSGGIFLLELDEETGLRDYAVTYEQNEHSDPYFGTKIAGGKYVSGEASYIQHIDDYYYLFVSYGNLEAKGGYNVRIFRSENPDGPYVDALGNGAYYDTYAFNYNQSVGVRLFGGYKWRTFTNGQVAQGHNSAFVDDDGKAYIVFHTRTTDGTEGHFVKVHQLFVNKEGWLVAAPYHTSGETLQSDINEAEIPGQYEVIIHKLDIDYGNLDVNRSEVIQLKEDGKITGAYEGSWEVTDGTAYLELSIDGVTYSGVVLHMNIENSSLDTIVFTALGIENQITLWGSKSFE